MTLVSKVKLITPTFNQGKFIEETINSVLNQTYSNIDYVIVDDGSTDNTADLLFKFRNKVKSKVQENIGQVRTLNNEWLDSDADFLSYLSSDDLLEPNAIEKCVDHLERHPDCVCVFPNSDLINSDSNIIKRRVSREFNLEDTIVEQECYIGPGAVFRRSAFEVVGPWNEKLKLAPDREFWIRLAQEGSIDFIKDCLARYRMHDESISFSVKDLTSSLEYLTVLDDIFNNSRLSIAHLKHPAYQAGHLLVSRNCFLRGDFLNGLKYIKFSLQYGLSWLFIRKLLSMFRVLIARLYWKIKV